MGIDIGDIVRIEVDGKIRTGNVVGIAWGPRILYRVRWNGGAEWFSEREILELVLN